METSAPVMFEYRVVLVRPDSFKVLAHNSEGGDLLPRVRIRKGGRPAWELCTAIKNDLSLGVLVLDFLVIDQSPSYCVVAELMMSRVPNGMKEVKVEKIAVTELCDEERHTIESILEGRSRSLFSAVGWIKRAETWIHEATGCKFASEAQIEQLNAGGNFALLRFRLDDGHDYWLKATGEPNAHEFGVTSCLAELGPDSLPRLIAMKKEWNAWLTEDAGKSLPDHPTGAVLLRGVKSFASLQMSTLGSEDALLSAGAFDQRLPVLRSNVDAVIAYLVEAMAHQTSTKAAPLEKDRLVELGEFLWEACLRMEALQIPDTLLHSDLNRGNILDDGLRCVFTDWSEAAVGNPFLSLDHICRMNSEHAVELRRAYRKCWSKYLTVAAIEEAFALMPLLAIFAYLYGRGTWLQKIDRVQAPFASYARSLARHMDRAARNPALLEVLCH